MEEPIRHVKFFRENSTKDAVVFNMAKKLNFVQGSKNLEMHSLFMNFEIKKRGLRIALFFTLASLASFLIGNAVLQFALLGLGLLLFGFTFVLPEATYSFTSWGLEFILNFLSAFVKGVLLLFYILIWKPVLFVMDLFRGDKNS